jgi:hypothetical protein
VDELRPGHVAGDAVGVLAAPPDPPLHPRLDVLAHGLIDRGAEGVHAGAARGPARYDYEYKREGVANLFLVFEPLLGWRHVRVTDRRTAVDFAEVLRWVVEDLHPGARRVADQSQRAKVSQQSVEGWIDKGGAGLPDDAVARFTRKIAGGDPSYVERHGEWVKKLLALYRDGKPSRGE